LSGDKAEMTERLTSFAKTLRKNTTQVESVLWDRLRGRQLEGIKFRRQQPVGRFIVDFVSLERRVLVELDGGQHVENTSKDRERDTELTARGFTVLRFWNNEVSENLEGVLEVIRDACLK
jgi:very-short-patch-repair endonuclease